MVKNILIKVCFEALTTTEMYTTSATPEFPSSTLSTSTENVQTTEVTTEERKYNLQSFIANYQRSFPFSIFGLCFSQRMPLGEW